MSAPCLAGRQQVQVVDGVVRLHRAPGAALSRKFVRQVEHRTSSGAEAAARGQTVLYVTERCVFRLCAQGLELIELAPGVDLQRDVLDLMDFEPLMPSPPVMLDARILETQPMR